MKSQTNSREPCSPDPAAVGKKCQQVSGRGREEQHTESRNDFHEIESMRGGVIEMIPGGQSREIGVERLRTGRRNESPRPGQK